MNNVISAKSKHRIKQRRSLAKVIADAAHLLPEQAPLTAFVHHNTLHAFEHLPFEEAVVKASKLLTTEPFQAEAAFSECLQTGRILPIDIDLVLRDAGLDDERQIFPGGPSFGQFRRQRLRNLFEIPRGEALQWTLTETTAMTQLWSKLPATRRADLLRSVRGGAAALREQAAPASVLEQLWQDLERVAPPSVMEPHSPRRRDQLLAMTHADTDDLVHPLLIRLCAAFLDQGVAYWAMPGRDGGLLSAFRQLYSLAAAPPDRFLRGLHKELREQQRKAWSSEQTIDWALKEMKVSTQDRAQVIQLTLLSLRGWAGMMHQLQQRPDRAPVEPRPASLSDYLAVQLVLDLFAARHVVSRHLGGSYTFEDLDNQLDAAASNQAGDAARASRSATNRQELVYEAFILAQLLPVNLSALGKAAHAKAWLKEVASFDELMRRRLLHLAYERRHRVGVLDGLAAHCRISEGAPPVAQFQAVFCIDDREESTRRHLEECCPVSQTFGYAGFFGVAMNYQGLDDIRPRPLCPVTIRPKHLIVERAISEEHEVDYAAKRRRQGTLSHALSVGSTTLARGSVVSATFGLATVIPLIGRCLFPRAAEALSHQLTHGAKRPPTRLSIERADDDEPEEHGYRGYTVGEMADVVYAALTTMALDVDFCALVLMVGHGSSSLNNPHEAAHDCGATGGGRGGPNARAFSAMANHPKVRALLAARGLTIPDTTWFVGAYHNTCDDSMTYYDEDLVPDAVMPLLLQAQQALALACSLDAHERCRRFESAPADPSLKGALAHAQTHASDLREPRPEYGHATNAVCIVGRRSRTRGLFLDRRAFLVSYDPTKDESGDILAKLLLSVGPVGAGINLEYYFSFVDPTGYGSGTKLPHNIVGLVGVMDGHASDLRTGLPWQMVEIHEPVRLLTIVEAPQERLEAILENHPALRQLIQNGWIQFVAWDPDSDKLQVFHDGALHPYQPETTDIVVVDKSAAFYRGQREHLGCAHIRNAQIGGAA